MGINQITQIQQTQNNKRTIVRPNLKVADVPYISTTPIQDALFLKEQEMTKVKTKKHNKKNIFKSEFLFSIPILSLGAFALIKLLKGKKP